jgi:hypothetical protein
MPPPNAPEVDIEIGNQITPEVHAGFQLFVKHATRPFDAASVRQWLYWFDKNPYGKGVFAVAKHGNKVVGFYALIPVEMRINDRSVLGGKGEFFVVAPDSRHTIFGQRSLRLPCALSAELHGVAAQYGMECVMLVSTPAAAICHAISGARTMRYDVDQYTMLFRGEQLTAGNLTRKQRCKMFLKVQFTTAQRLLAGIRRLGAKGGHFETVSSLGALPEPEGTNLLVGNSEKMLAFRFPAEQYLIYSVQDAEGRQAFLVFNSPHSGTNVRLKHWSAQNIPFQNVATVFGDVVRRCRRNDAASLSAAIPTSEANHLGPIASLGFRHTQSSASIQVYSGTNDISVDPACWRFTQSHIGFIGFD